MACGTVTVLVLGLGLAPSALAAVPPVAVRTPAVVTADVLPTAQIDGVAWSQALVHDTVYVGGDFTTARPAGAAAGVATVPRADLMAYSVTTGAYTSFAPNPDNQVYAVAASPDGTRLYIGGQFTHVGGVTRNRIAAFDTATGQLVASFAPSLSYTVKALVATNDTVYAGGAFTVANKTGRNRLAAFSARDGSLRPWNPGTDNTVQALTLTPDLTGVVVGGAFTQLAGTSAIGLGAVDAVTGASRPFAANQVVRNSGSGAAILSLTTANNTIYGSGYTFGGGGTLEGAFAAEPTTGALRWVEDCHGDTYAVAATPGAAYVVSHSHFCGNVGGFPETNPRTHHHALAFTLAATGTLAHDTFGGTYHDWGGTAAPSMINWFPDLAVGTYTGIDQAAWSVTGDDRYVVLGGEFPSVNGRAQQGLVRFAVPALAPKKDGPRVSGAALTPTVTVNSDRSVTVTATSDWDRDDMALTYVLQRDGQTLQTVTASSTFWNRPPLSYTDRTALPGPHAYRVVVTDPDANRVVSGSATATVPATATGG